MREQINQIVGQYTQADWYGLVTFDGKPLPLAPSLRIMNHSPDGFAWSYGGSGPAQLALAILLEAGASKEVALKNYQAFKKQFIQPLARASFTLEVNVAAWLQEASEHF